MQSHEHVTPDPSQVTLVQALDAHYRCVALERRLAIQRGWKEADEAGREAARRVFRRAARQGVSATWTADVDVLTLGLRALSGQDWEGGAERDLALLAGAIDLRPIPGAFDVGAGPEAGTPITVHGNFLRAVAGSETTDEGGEWIDMDLALFWVGPDGQEELARREPLHRGGLGVEGFRMFVRSPLEAGTWRLVPRLERAGVAARGQGVVVEGIPGLTDSLRRLADAEEATDRQRVATTLRMGEGMRFAALETLAPLLADPAAAGWPRAVHTDAGMLGWVLDPPQGSSVRGIVLVAAPRAEDPLWLFCEEGRAWHELAREGFVVASSHLDLIVGEGAHLGTWMGALAEATPDVPRILVLRGDRVGELALARRLGFEPFFDSLVLSVTLTEGRRPQRQGDRPILFHQPLADLEEATEERLGPPDASPLTWLATPDPPLIAERRLPELLLRWLGG